MESLPKLLYLPPEGRPRWVPPPGDSLSLQYLGWGSRTFGNQPIPTTRHPGWVYAVVLSGEPRLVLEDQSIRTHAFEGWVLDPECGSGWLDVRDQKSELLVWMWKTPPRCQELTPPTGGWVRKKLAKDSVRKLLQVHRSVRLEVERTDPWTPLALEKSRLEMELAWVRKARGSTRKISLEVKFNQAMHWLQEHPFHSKPVSALMDYLQISQPTLHRLFKGRTGLSVAEYHQREKMKYAEVWLKEKRYSQKEIAYQLGYRHPADFSRAFKIYSGKSPREYGK